MRARWAAGKGTAELRFFEARERKGEGGVCV